MLTWNIQWGRGADGRVDLAHGGGVRGKGDFDVICLQWLQFPGLAGGARGDEPRCIWRRPFHDYEAVFAAGMDVPDGEGGRARFGNLLLSRLAVGQVFRHLLPAPADPAFPAMQRVCVEAVVSAGRGPLRVLTTHLRYAARQRPRRSALRALRRSRRADRSASGGAESNPAFAAQQRGRRRHLCAAISTASRIRNCHTVEVVL